MKSLFYFGLHRMTLCVLSHNRKKIPLHFSQKHLPKSPSSNLNSKTSLWFSLRTFQEQKTPSTPHQQPIFSDCTCQLLLEPLFFHSIKFRYFPSLSLHFTFDLFTRNLNAREHFIFSEESNLSCKILWL